MQRPKNGTSPKELVNTLTDDTGVNSAVGSLTPASTGVSLNEINAIAPFDTNKQRSFTTSELQYPFETALLSQDAATQLALKKSKSEHEAMLKFQVSALELNCSSIVHQYFLYPQGQERFI